MKALEDTHLYCFNFDICIDSVVEVHESFSSEAKSQFVDFIVESRNDALLRFKINVHQTIKLLSYIHIISTPLIILPLYPNIYGNPEIGLLYFLDMHMQNPLQMHTVLITGVSRGLGYQLMKLLIEKNPDIRVIGTVRNNKQQFQHHINQLYQPNNVMIEQLDITSKQNISLLVARLQSYNIMLDAVVNNAAVMLVPTGSSNESQALKGQQTVGDIAHKTFANNFYGTISFTKKILTILKDNGRIINVSSRLGALKHHGKQIQEKFSNPEINIGDIDLHISKYIQALERGDCEEYFSDIYGTSKMFLNAWNRFILPKILISNQQAIAMSPGHCKTDMGGTQAPRSVEDGALAMYMLLWGEYSPDKFYHCDGVSDYQNCGPAK